MSKYLGPRAEAKKQLERETRKAGGVKAISASKRDRDAVYKGIAEMFKFQNPLCQACVVINPIKKPNWTDDIHHRVGRIGLLLFDVRKFVAICRHCHNWVHENPSEAKRLKLLG